MNPRPKRRWRDLSRRQRKVIIGAAVVQITLLAAAQRDITVRPAGEIRGGKWLWRVLTLVNFVGPIAYFFCGIRRDRNGSEAGGSALRSAA